MNKHCFLKAYKIHSVCAKHEENRVHSDFEYIYFVNGFAYATDGRIAVKIPLDVCTSFDDEEWRKLDDTRIHYSLMKILRQYNDISISLDTENADRDTLLPDMSPGTSVLLRAQQDDNALIVKLEKNTKRPDFMTVMAITEDPKPISHLGIKPDLLKTLAEAMGVSSITLRFTEANGKVFIQDWGESNRSLGIIIPLVTEAQLPGFED